MSEKIKNTIIGKKMRSPVITIICRDIPGMNFTSLRLRLTLGEFLSSSVVFLKWTFIFASTQ